MDATASIISAAEQEALLGLAVALAIGLLFGVERGYHRQQQEQAGRAAGLRTFGLIGLLGGVAGLLTKVIDTEIYGWLFLGMAAIFATVYVINVTNSEDRGSTSLVASLLTFGLGSLAAVGHVATASSAAVVATLLLGFKPQLHAWVGRIEESELHATLKLLLITVVLLPILPDRGFGPAAALNPYELWWMVVLIASISYLGYFAVRMAGPGKGLVMTSLVAGLASSTALTVQLARMARGSSNSDANLLAAGILIANATLFPRILVIIALTNTSLLALLIVPLALMTLLIAVPSLLLWLNRQQNDNAATLEVSNPLELGMALRFGALLAVIMLAGKLAADAFGNAGVLALAAVSGVADLNAITLSIARMDDPAVTQQIAVVGILLAVLTNSVFKAGFTAAVGGARLGLRVALPLVGTAAIGLALVWFWGEPLRWPIDLDLWR